jgi:hypothetical protein
VSDVPPPPPPPPPPSDYPGNYYGAAGADVREHPAGTTVLVLGILSLVICGLLGPIAWVKGNTAKREMEAQPGVQWSNRGSITAGRICGMIASILLIVGVVAFVVLVATAS